MLDTHVFVWWFEDSRRLSKEQQRMLKRVGDDVPAFVPDISLWEVATLVSLGRLRPRMPLGAWLETALEREGVVLQPITPNIAAEVERIGTWAHRDPADRVIVATARVLGVPLLTHDEVIQGSGLVQTIA